MSQHVVYNLIILSRKCIKRSDEKRIFRIPKCVVTHRLLNKYQCIYIFGNRVNKKIISVQTNMCIDAILQIHKNMNEF